jgi:hypothetical protein
VSHVAIHDDRGTVDHVHGEAAPLFTITDIEQQCLAGKCGLAADNDPLVLCVRRHDHVAEDVHRAGSWFSEFESLVASSSEHAGTSASAVPSWLNGETEKFANVFAWLDASARRASGRGRRLIWSEPDNLFGSSQSFSESDETKRVAAASVGTIERGDRQFAGRIARKRKTASRISSAR